MPYEEEREGPEILQMVSDDGEEDKLFQSCLCQSSCSRIPRGPLGLLLGTVSAIWAGIFM